MTTCGVRFILHAIENKLEKEKFNDMNIIETFPRVRSESGTAVQSAASQERPEDGDSDDDRGSGEYYSGEEFHDDDIMLTKDR